MRTADRCEHDTLFAWLRFALMPGIPRAAQRALLAHFGSPQAALAAPPMQVAARLGPGPAAAWVKGPHHASVERAWKWLESSQGHFIALGDAEYPRLLLETGDPPIAFFATGRLELLSAASIAIVGSRNATPPGESDAERFAQALSDAGLTIVSGLALGIDARAHRGGLAGRSSSIAVMGTGPDIYYPRANQALAQRLAVEGLLMTELPPGTPPRAENFPNRNRILSGLARGVIVVEAAPESGSLITARLALEQNREVFAMPGSIHAPLARGCHALIKQGAKLVECVDDVLEELGMAGDAPAPAPQAPPSRRDALLEALGHAPASIDELAQRTGRNAAHVAARLVELEIEGRVATLSGGRFQRTAPA